MTAAPAITAPLVYRARLNRETFRTSRLLEFCSQKELVAQTGHEVDDWPVVILKEAVDNAIDACEEADIAPDIAVKVSTATGEIAISDNGPGIPNDTIAGILDYTRPGVEPRGILLPGSWCSRQCPEDASRDGVRPLRRSRRDRDRGPGAGAPHRLSGRPCPPGTADCARGLDLFCKKRHCDSGVAGRSQLAQS